MKMNVALALMLSALALTAAPAKKGEPRVDSVVYDKGMEWKVFPTKSAVTAFAIDGQNCYVATAEDVTSFTIKTGAPTPIPNLGKMPVAGVTAMTTDGAGSIWFGSREGVAVKTKSGFTNYSAATGLASNNVAALSAVGDGSLWVGTSNGVSILRNGSWKTYTTKDGLAGDQVTALAAGVGDGVWIGTTKGITLYGNGKFTTYTMAKDNCLSWNDTKALAFDPRSKTLWAAVGEQDINSFNGTDWNQYMNIAAGVLSIMADSQSRIWFGLSTGLLKFNGDEWISEAAKLGVPAVAVTQMVKDSAGNLWFASDKGVFFVNNPYPF